MLCFRFNEQSPNLVVAGLANGQLVLWDTNEKEELAVSMGSAAQENSAADAGANTHTTMYVITRAHFCFFSVSRFVYAHSLVTQICSTSNGFVY